MFTWVAQPICVNYSAILAAVPGAQATREPIIVQEDEATNLERCAPSFHGSFTIPRSFLEFYNARSKYASRFRKPRPASCEWFFAPAWNAKIG